MADHLLSDAEYHRIRRLFRLDRTVVANTCHYCNRPLVHTSDDYGGGVRMYLECDDPSCTYTAERVA